MIFFNKKFYKEIANLGFFFFSLDNYINYCFSFPENKTASKQKLCKTNYSSSAVLHQYIFVKLFRSYHNPTV